MCQSSYPFIPCLRIGHPKRWKGYYLLFLSFLFTGPNMKVLIIVRKETKRMLGPVKEKEKKKIARIKVYFFFLSASHYIFYLFVWLAKKEREERNYVRVCGSVGHVMTGHWPPLRGHLRPTNTLHFVTLTTRFALSFFLYESITWPYKY